MNQTVTVHTDGASRGNPGAASIAYVIEGLGNGEVKFGQAIGVTTNNQAEYQAMVAAVEYLASQSLINCEINFLADSELMIKQINGIYRVRDALLQPHYNRVIAVCTQLKDSGNSLTFTAIRREQNQESDRLANAALDNR